MVWEAADKTENFNWMIQSTYQFKRISHCKKNHNFTDEVNLIKFVSNLWKEITKSLML